MPVAWTKQTWLINCMIHCLTFLCILSGVYYRVNIIVKYMNKNYLLEMQKKHMYHINSLQIHCSPRESQMMGQLFLYSCKYVLMAKDLTNVKNWILIGIGNFELKCFFVHYMIQLWTKMANSKLVYYGKTMLYGLGKHKCLMSFVKCIYSFFSAI